MFDDLLAYLDDCGKRARKIEDYFFDVCIVDGDVTTEIAKISNYDFFYILDNGSPIYQIMPLSLTRKLYDYFKKRLSKEMEVELDEYIDGYRDDIDFIFRRYASRLTQYIQRMIATYNDDYSLMGETEVENDDKEIERKISEEKISLGTFSRKVIVKAFYKGSIL